MPLVFVGTVVLVLWIFEIGPVANWSWYWVAAPFAIAVAWWAYADTTGLTQRRAIRKMEERKVARRERDMIALGLDPQRDRRKRNAAKAAAKSGAAGKPPQAKG